MNQVGTAGWWLNLKALDRRLASRWLSWADSPAGSALLEGWTTRHPELRSWSHDDLVNPRYSPRTDAMQAALVSLAQDGSAEAGLTLLVQLRPGLSRLARTAAGWDWIMTHDVEEEVQATFFETLFGLDLNRRRRRIAANLLLDTRQKLWRRLPRSGPPTVDRPGQNLEQYSSRQTIPRHWIDELEVWLHFRDGLNHLPGSEASRRLTATMAFRAWVEDEPTAAIAVDLGVAP